MVMKQTLVIRFDASSAQLWMRQFNNFITRITQINLKIKRPNQA